MHIGDEQHYLFVCGHYITDRKSCFKFHIFTKSPNNIKFNELFSSVNTRNLVKVSSFVEIIIKTFSSVT